MASTQTPSRKKAKDAKLNELTAPPESSTFGNDGELLRIRKTLNGGLQNSIKGKLVDSPRLLGRNIVCIGDSITELNGFFGYSVSFSGAPACVKACSASVDTPVGAGTLTFDGSKYMAWNANGETPGNSVDVSTGGIFRLYSSGGSNISIEITAGLFAGNFSSSGTRGVNFYWQRQQGAWMYVADAYTGHRLQWINLGIGGNTSLDIAIRYQQAMASNPVGIVDFYGTNDLVAAGRTPEAYIATRTANWEEPISLGIPVFAFLLTPRNDPNFTSLSAAQQKAFVRANKLIVDSARARPGVYIVDGFSGIVDPASATGAPKTNFMSDGLHFGPDAGYSQGRKLASIINSLFPAEAMSTPPMVGALALYDAVNNPGGNLIPSGHGSFIGTGGSGTNVTGPIPAGWTWARNSGAAATAVASVIPATDGGADWWALTISGATAQGEQFWGYPDYLNVSNIQTGDIVETVCEFEVIGGGCYSVRLDLLGDGSMTSVSGLSALQLSNIAKGITGQFVLANEPCKWLSTGVTAALPRLYVQSNIGGNFVVKMRNLIVHKV
jgi:lysophospholipase L1-like esterase